MGIEDRNEAYLAEQYAVIGQWRTDFRQKSVSLAEFDVVLVRDRIVPIDKPEFAQVSKPPEYMRPDEPVIAVSFGADARAYPLAILMWHEIVNDTVGGKPVAVTFCPLCNSSLVFERMVNGRVLSFGTSGALRHSDLVMWDRQTESWWQQVTGEALVGSLTGSRLAIVQSSVMSWHAFVEAYPAGKVLERVFRSDGSPLRPYDDPPYAGYDRTSEPPFLFAGTLDGRLLPTSRVLALEVSGVAVAYPFEFLKAQGVVNDMVGGSGIVAMFDPQVQSPFRDTRGDSWNSGAATLFSRTLAGKTLTFAMVDGTVRDTETGSEWTTTGMAVSGPMAGASLQPLPHGNYFWFAWAVFKPETELRSELAHLHQGP